jgi:predicted amidohydrolase
LNTRLRSDKELKVSATLCDHNELIFDLGIGDIFSARVAENVVNNDILGSLEFS